MDKIIVAGSAGTGKSRLLIKKVYEDLKKEDVLFISSELSRESIEAQLISLHIWETEKVLVSDMDILRNRDLDAKIKEYIKEAILYMGSTKGRLFVRDSLSHLPRKGILARVKSSKESVVVCIDITQSIFELKENLEFFESDILRDKVSKVYSSYSMPSNVRDEDIDLLGLQLKGVVGENIDILTITNNPNTRYVKDSKSNRVEKYTVANGILRKSSLD